MSRSIIYSLRDYKGKPILDYKYSLGITHEDNRTLTVNLPTETITLNKPDWVNKMRVYESGNVWFIVCTKAVSADYVLEFLIAHAVKKIEARISHLNTLKTNYEKLIVAA